MVIRPLYLSTVRLGLMSARQSRDPPCRSLRHSPPSASQCIEVVTARACRQPDTGRYVMAWMERHGPHYRVRYRYASLVILDGTYDTADAAHDRVSRLGHLNPAVQRRLTAPAPGAARPPPTPAPWPPQPRSGTSPPACPTCTPGCWSSPRPTPGCASANSPA